MTFRNVRISKPKRKFFRYYGGLIKEGRGTVSEGGKEEFLIKPLVSYYLKWVFTIKSGYI